MNASLRSAAWVVIGLVCGGVMGAQEPAPSSVRTIRDIKPPFEFTIRTTTPDGQPQPGVAIRCVHPRSTRGPALVDAIARTDANGTARFTVADANLLTDRYVWFGVAGDDFAGRGDVGISPIDREFTFTFKTLPLHQRTVRLVDPQGKGVAGAKVWLCCPDIFPDNSDRRSDSEGRIVLKCPPGKLIVAAVAPGYASTTLHGLECNDDPPLVIRLSEGRRIEGQILDTQGRPVGDLLVRARKDAFFHSQEEFILQTRSGKDGRFAIRNASPGDWEISAKSEDPHRPLFVAPVTCGVGADRDTQDIALEAREGFRIKGRYVSRYRTESTSPGAGHDITLGAFSPVRASWEEQSRSDGTFDIWGLPCHAEGIVDFTGVSGFHMMLRMPNAPPFFRVRNTDVRFENVPPGTYDGIEVQFLLAGRVEGTVTDGAGDPIQNVEVVVDPPGYIYRCNEKGEFAGTLAPDVPTTLTVRTRREESGAASPTVETLLVSDPFTAQEGQIVEKHLVLGAGAQSEPSSSPQRPSLASLNIDVKPETLSGKRVLVCFFDVSQRPSRRFVQELAAQAKPLAESGLAALLIQVEEPDEAASREVLDQIRVPFPMGTTSATMSALSRDWTVRALPWLVLLDESHAVQATGFDLAQLEEGLKSAASRLRPGLSTGMRDSTRSTTSRTIRSSSTSRRRSSRNETNTTPARAAPDSGCPHNWSSIGTRASVSGAMPASQAISTRRCGWFWNSRDTNTKAPREV